MPSKSTKYSKRSAYSRSKPRRSKRVAADATVSNVDANGRWLPAARRELAQAVDSGMNVYDAAEALNLEPVQVLQFIGAGGMSDLLKRQGLNFTFERGSEEEAEVLGLCLAGTSLAASLRWCLAADDRLSASELQSSMTRPDARPGLYLAREMGIWFSHSRQIAPLLELVALPKDAVRAAVARAAECFEVPSPTFVLHQVKDGGRALDAYPWQCTDRSASVRETVRRMAEAPAPTSTVTRKRYSRSGASPRSRQRSPASLADGRPPVDRRTAAEKAWELRETW